MAKMESNKEDMKEDKKLIKKAFAMHDKQEHHGKHTNLTKLAKGGVSGKAMMQHGRNMARVMNQRSGRGG
jgi:hypothetical protein